MPRPSEITIPPGRPDLVGPSFKAYAVAVPWPEAGAAIGWGRNPPFLLGRSVGKDAVSLLSL